MSTRRYPGQKPRWADPNVEHREQLQRNLLQTPGPADPLGLALAARAREAEDAYVREREAENPFYRTSDAGMNQSSASAGMRASGWGAYLHGLTEAAQRIAGPDARLRLVGGPSPEGSNQLRGTSTQPRENASLAGLRRAARQRELAQLDATEAYNRNAAKQGNTDWNANSRFGK